jgi:hypothetical protein
VCHSCLQIRIALLCAASKTKKLYSAIFSYAPLQFNIQVTVMVLEAIRNLQDIAGSFSQLAVQSIFIFGCSLAR